MANAPKKSSRTQSPSSSRIAVAISRPTLAAVHARMRELANPDDAQFLQRFFKTGPGQYGEGDHFLGIRVPVLRAVAREFRNLSTAARWSLLKSRWHEERLLALILIVDLHAKADASEQERIADQYLAHARYINNWDLVDSSAEHVLGPHVQSRGIGWLRKLARSTMLWERRIAMLATFDGIKDRSYNAALVIAEDLLDDEHDLMHKAVGWMLREIGKRDRSVLVEFLRTHHTRMPRTALRYAIEHFPEAERQRYLKGRVQA